jgi:hypothetical protein
MSYEYSLFMADKKTNLSILSVVAITSFMGTFLVSAVNIALPSIGSSLSLSAIELSWIINVEKQASIYPFAQF